MFRQAKRRITSRRNFAGQVGDSSGKFILDGTTTEEESKLYESLYESKLSFYQMPPKGEITLEQFEVWAINRLKVLLEIESCIQRNKSPKEMEIIVKPLLNKLASAFYIGRLARSEKGLLLALYLEALLLSLQRTARQVYPVRNSTSQATV